VIIFIIAIFYWFGVARLVRGETLALRNREYVQAVKVIGGRPLRRGQAHRCRTRFGTKSSVQARSRSPTDPHAVGPRSSPSAWHARDRLGLDALRRPELHPGRHYWWLIYPPGVAII